MPTAFDKKNVIEELKNKAEAFRKYWSEFDDDMTDDEINDEINDWAEQFLETW